MMKFDQIRIIGARNGQISGFVEQDGISHDLEVYAKAARRLA